MRQNSTDVLFRQVGPAVAAFVDGVRNATEHILRDGVAGIYLIGSVAFADFQAASSDVDVIVVTKRSLPLDDRQHLADGVAAVPIPVRGLEFVVYPREVLQHLDATPRWELNLNVGPRLASPHVGFDPTAELRYWVV